MKGIKYHYKEWVCLKGIKNHYKEWVCLKGIKYNYKEWVCLKGIKYHYKECAKQPSKKKDLIVQSQVLAGHIKQKPSNLMVKEVLSIMTNDETSQVAQKDQLIMALGESWVRRNMGNVEKHKYYASLRMRLCARLLINLNELENQPAGEETKQDHEDEQEAHGP